MNEEITNEIIKRKADMIEAKLNEYLSGAYTIQTNRYGIKLYTNNGIITEIAIRKTEEISGLRFKGVSLHDRYRFAYFS